MFVPAIVDAPKKLGATKVRRARPPRKASTSAAIELEIDGATVRIASGADAQTIAAVVQALKATCKLNGVEPFGYLADVLTRIVNGHPKRPNRRAPALGLHRTPKLKAVA